MKHNWGYDETNHELVVVLDPTSNYGRYRFEVTSQKSSGVLDVVANPGEEIRIPFHAPPGSDIVGTIFFDGDTVDSLHVKLPNSFNRLLAKFRSNSSI